MHHSNGHLTPSEPMDSDAEDEVDQLISDSESPETETDPQNDADGHRVPGQTLLPAVRLENIMSADGVTGNLSLSKEGLFVLSVAAVRYSYLEARSSLTGSQEEFIKKMARAGHLRASNERRTAVNYSDMSTIPVPVPLSEAISLRAQKEKEAQESDPTAPSSSRLSLSVPKKAKSRPNGTTPKHDKRPAKEPRPSTTPADSDSTYTDWIDTRPPRPGGRPSISVYNGRLSLSARPSPLANGHSVSAAPSRSSTITPAQSRDPSDAASVQHQPSTPVPSQPEENWSAQAPPPPPPPYAAGPASGFLQGPGGPFGRVSQNPGRTIYSQQYRTE
ncbi:hypothetical protein C0989_001651 [Termitomyces sp. Mn162]|nr:hypothetical protein C0989_001651 [Termitomyces sp. Mn162]